MRVSVTLLQYEHGLIRQVADILGAVVKHRLAQKYLSDVKEIIVFQEKFTDRLHHYKEETFVFPAAVEEGGITAEEMRELITDHDHARFLIRSMADSLRHEDLEKFYHDALEFVEMMLAHIRKEEDSYFPRIEDSMDTDTDTAIYKRFEDYTMKNYPTEVYQITESFANRVQDAILGPGYFERMH
jgi:hemerythrin-like domain-containing protein